MQQVRTPLPLSSGLWDEVRVGPGKVAPAEGGQGGLWVKEGAGVLIERRAWGFPAAFQAARNK